ncbi:MAG: imelysin family protein [Bacteroidota bacterium]
MHACSIVNPDPGEENVLEQTRQAQLENVSRLGAVPILNQSVEISNRLVDASNQLQQELNLNNLEQVRQIWKELGLTLARYEIYDHEANRVTFGLTRFPVDPEFIEERIADSSPTADEISSRPTLFTPFNTIEYLIFGDDAMILDKLASNPRRLVYLNQLVAYTDSIVQEFLKKWSDEQADYESALEIGVYGSQNKIANSMIKSIEFARRFRLGVALGDFQGGEPDPELLEAFRSEFSLEFLKANFEEFKLAFFGNYPDAVQEIGFHDYLLAVDQAEVADEFTQVLSNIDAQLLDMDILKDELIQNPDKVRALRDEYETLSRLLKLDLPNATGVVVIFFVCDKD